WPRRRPRPRGRLDTPRFTGNTPRFGHPSAAEGALLFSCVSRETSPSPQRAPGGEPNPSRPTVPDGASHGQDRHAGRGARSSLGAKQPQLRQPLGRPSIRPRRIRRLPDPQPPARSQEADPALRGRSRASEATGHDQIEPPPEAGIPRQGFGPTAGDRAPVQQLQLPKGVVQIPAAVPPGIEQHAGRPRPDLQQDQPRNPGPRPEIQEAAPELGLDGGRHRLGVLQVCLDGTGPEHSSALGDLELLRQPSPPVPGDHRPPGQAGRITTRRRGSSPSETVLTPSISATTSSTTLRSEAPIG